MLPALHLILGAASICLCCAVQAMTSVNPTVYDSIKALGEDPNTDVIVFSGSDRSKLEETFGDLNVWLAAENGMYLRSPGSSEEVTTQPVNMCTQLCDFSNSRLEARMLLSLLWESSQRQRACLNTPAKRWIISLDARDLNCWDDRSPEDPGRVPETMCVHVCRSGLLWSTCPRWSGKRASIWCSTTSLSARPAPSSRPATHLWCGTTSMQVSLPSFRKPWKVFPPCMQEQTSQQPGCNVEI